jgi:hypothetical protein
MDGVRDRPNDELLLANDVTPLPTVIPPWGGELLHTARGIEGDAWDGRRKRLGASLVDDGLLPEPSANEKGLRLEEKELEKRPLVVIEPSAAATEDERDVVGVGAADRKCSVLANSLRSYS